MKANVEAQFEDYDDRDLRGGHDCVDHQWTDEGVCAVCHEALTEEDDER